MSLTTRTMARRSRTDRPVSRWETVQNWLDGTGSTDRIVLARIDYGPRDVRSRDDVRRVLDLSVPEFVGAVLLDDGDRVTQRTFAEYTDWSPSQVSRILTELEDDGAIACLRDGQEKVVSFPRRRGPWNREIG